MVWIYYTGREGSLEGMGFYRECGGEVDVNVGVDDLRRECGCFCRRFGAFGNGSGGSDDLT
jgi:hypothetical protein